MSRPEGKLKMSAVNENENNSESTIEIGIINDNHKHQGLTAVDEIIKDSITMGAEEETAVREETEMVREETEMVKEETEMA